MTVDEKLDQLADKIDARFDQIEQGLLLKFHGERGTNGIYGRLHRLEIDSEHRRSSVNRIWGAICVLGSAVAGGLFQAMTGFLSGGR